jgi:hypothetical protein
MGTGSIRPYAADAIKSVLFPIGRLFETANDFMIFSTVNFESSPE